jgi:hypothetical protein
MRDGIGCSDELERTRLSQLRDDVCTAEYFDTKEVAVVIDVNIETRMHERDRLRDRRSELGEEVAGRRAHQIDVAGIGRGIVRAFVDRVRSKLGNEVDPFV